MEHSFKTPRDAALHSTRLRSFVNTFSEQDGPPQTKNPRSGDLVRLRKLSSESPSHAWTRPWARSVFCSLETIEKLAPRPAREPHQSASLARVHLHACATDAAPSKKIRRKCNRAAKENLAWIVVGTAAAPPNAPKAISADTSARRLPLLSKCGWGHARDRKTCIGRVPH